MKIAFVQTICKLATSTIYRVLAIVNLTLFPIKAIHSTTFDILRQFSQPSAGMDDLVPLVLPNVSKGGRQNRSRHYRRNRKVVEERIKLRY